MKIVHLAAKQLTRERLVHAALLHQHASCLLRYWGTTVWGENFTVSINLATSGDYKRNSNLTHEKGKGES